MDPGENFKGGPVADDMWGRWRSRGTALQPSILTIAVAAVLRTAKLPRSLALQDGVVASRRRPGAFDRSGDRHLAFGAPSRPRRRALVALRQAGLADPQLIAAQKASPSRRCVGVSSSMFETRYRNHTRSIRLSPMFNANWEPVHQPCPRITN